MSAALAIPWGGRREMTALHLVKSPGPMPTLDVAGLVREHEAALRATAMRLCRDATDAGDLVQDTFERALRSRDRLRPGSNLRAWLLTILRNLFIDRCRRSAREPRSELKLELIDSGAAMPEPEAEPRWASITVVQLRGAVEQLPEEFRSVYLMHALEGRSYAEISTKLGIPGATVGTRLIRARRKLKALLQTELGLDEEDGEEP
jgi:RNA polymerase sigma-70 factor, ECF subfamily